MANITVTITDITKGPFSVASLFAGAVTGTTKTPASPNPVPKLVSCCTIQNDPANASANVYYGDKNTKNDGTCQAGSLPPGGSKQYPTMYVPLSGIYIQASSNGTLVNVEVL